MERGMRGRKEDDSGWRDVEDGPDEEKTHPRSISRILPQGLPRRLLLWVDDWDAARSFGASADGTFSHLPPDCVPVPLPSTDRFYCAPTSETKVVCLLQHK